MTKDELMLLRALRRQDDMLRQIRRRQSWWSDLSSNVAGNAIFDGAVWLISKLIKRI